MGCPHLTCTFPLPHFHKELGPSVTLVTRVTNRNFSKAMGDTSSTAYRSFVEEFSRTVRSSPCHPPPTGGHWGRDGRGGALGAPQGTTQPHW